MPDDREEEFRRLYQEHADRLLAYALRRVPAEDAPEVVAETFLTAWRRANVVPEDPVAWLFGVARRVVANRRRSLRRQQALRLKVQRESVRSTRSAPEPSMQLEIRMAIRKGLEQLSERDREALMLVGWDGLDNQSAASAMGCTPSVFAVRLHRARRRLRRHLKGTPGLGHFAGEGRLSATPANEEAR